MPTIVFRSMSEKHYRVMRRVLIGALIVLGCSLIAVGIIALIANEVFGEQVRVAVVDWGGRWLLFRSLSLALLSGAVCLYCWRQFYIHERVLENSRPAWSGAFVLPIMALLLFAYMCYWRSGN